MSSIYIDNYNLRFNLALQALEYNSGNEVWVEVPVPTGDLALANGKILVGNSSNIATPVNLSGAGTISNTGVLTLMLAPDNLIVGNPSGVGVASATLRVDDANTSMGLNVAPPVTASGFVFKTSGGAVQFIGTSADLVVGRDVFVAHDNSGAVHTYHIVSTDATAPLDLNATVIQSVRMPNMTTTQKNGMVTQAAGCMVFDTTLGKLSVYNGSTWETVTSV